ncbi:DnaJ domain-containing protein [Halorubrum aquaticum]|uniref:DnaJ domain-containing protein n=1 Tax=Halorubrum aquaticum TaxID=387340 RepID=A0A1I3C5U4_9EURY|nr:J domain-containing protein [Halorubrum aquaticum]SFH69783.1 DnaJ domain-containing protein [Halorubrum aquaticum]
MTNRTVVVGLAATFVGLTALLVVAGVVVNPLLLAVAVPFGAAAYLMWFHASGRLRERVRREADRLGPTERERAEQRARAAENRRDTYRTAGVSGSRSASGTTGARGGTRGRNRTAAGDARDRAPSTHGMSEREAYATLDLDPSADGETVRSTYRERAKRLHPDGEDGDEEAFKELNRAYEVLTD